MTKKRDQKDQQGEKIHHKQKRKPYEKPQLTQYGHIEKLTQGAGASVADVVFKQPRR